MPYKPKEKDEDLIRQPHEDVAIYRNDPHPAPNVMRRSSATTIVPKGGEIDNSLRGGSESREAGSMVYPGDNAATGGFVSDNFPDLMDTLTQGTSTQNAPMTVQPPPPTMAPPPAAAPQQPAADMNVPAAPQTSPQLPGMPPSITPDKLAGYLNMQKQGLDKFGPEAQMQLQQALNARKGSMGYKIADAGKGFADALMQGVARAGNPGWQNQFESQQNQYAADQMNTLRGAQEGNIKNTEAKMTLDKMNPNSDLSRNSQESYGPLFEKLGYKPDKIKGMSASNIESALNLMTQYGGQEVQAKIKEFELQIERMRLAEAAGKNSADAEIQRQKVRTDAAKELLDKSKNARVLGIPIPFTNDVSGKEEDAARKTLVDQLDGNEITPDVKAYSVKHGISPQKALEIKRARGG